MVVALQPCGFLRSRAGGMDALCGRRGICGRGLGKLHGLLAELDEALARLADGWSGLATVAEALAAMVGRIELAGAKGKWLAGATECGAKWGAPGKAL